jgi:hypothetical protein
LDESAAAESAKDTFRGVARDADGVGQLGDRYLRCERFRIQAVNDGLQYSGF